MKMPDSEQVVIVVSGAMDSVTLAFVLQAADAGIRQKFLSFDYGHRHRRALAFACSAARRLDAPHHTVDLLSASTLLPGPSFEPVDRLVQPARKRAVRPAGRHEPCPSRPTRRALPRRRSHPR